LFTYQSYAEIYGQQNIKFRLVQFHVLHYVIVVTCSLKAYKLPEDIVLLSVKIWSLTQREVRRLRMFENRVLRKIFGGKRDEVTREWRRLHNQELSDLYSSQYIIRVIKSRRMRWAGHVARMGERGAGEVHTEFAGET